MIFPTLDVLALSIEFCSTRAVLLTHTTTELKTSFLSHNSKRRQLQSCLLDYAYAYQYCCTTSSVFRARPLRYTPDLVVTLENLFPPRQHPMVKYR